MNLIPEELLTTNTARIVKCVVPECENVITSTDTVNSITIVGTPATLQQQQQSEQLPTSVIGGSNVIYSVPAKVTAKQNNEQKQQQQQEIQRLSNKLSKHHFLHVRPIKNITNSNNSSSNSVKLKTNVGVSSAFGVLSVTTTMVGFHHHHHHQHLYTAQKLYAKALYDNVADSPDELAFRKGDILAVIEQDTDGLVGWWLCTLNGRQGLCPGNRLRILNSYDSGCFSPSPASSPCHSLAASTATLNSSICSADIYENTSIISSTGSQSSTSTNRSGNGGNNPNGSVGGNAYISTSQLQLNTTNVGNANATNSYLQSQIQQRQGTRRSWHVSPNKVITPLRHGDVYVYQNPASQLLNTSSAISCNSLDSNTSTYSTTQQIYENLPVKCIDQEFATYDIPKSPIPINYDTPKSLQRTMAHFTPTTLSSSYTHTPMNNMNSNSLINTIQEENYDVPRPLLTTFHQHSSLTPSSSNSSLLTSDSLSLSFSSSNRSSLVNMPDYDVPRRNPLPVRALWQQQQQQQQLQNHNQQLLTRSNFRTSANTDSLSYDFPLTSSNVPKSISTLLTTKELPLELSSALENLAKLQTESTTAITRLLSFVSPNWRTPEKLEPVLMDVKLAAVRLRSALHDLTEFGEGSLGNATRSEDRTLAQKLRPIIKALRDSNKLVQDSCEVLELNGGWSLENLVREEDKNMCKPPDSLDQLVACAQTLTEDVRSTTSFIQGNASLLFKRQLPEVLEEEGTTANDGNVEENKEDNTVTKSEWLEDYDYVSFESKDKLAKKNSTLREAISDNLKNQFDNVLKVAENTVITASQTTTNGKKSASELSEKDKVLVRYYAVQISTHMGNLRQAIDSFLETVEKNQPPKFFIAYGKFVVVSAHNLVSIGDMVHRNVAKIEFKEKILRCTDALAEALKTCVLKSKQAAAHFPSVTAVQEMVDAVVDISHIASDLKAVMLHAVQLTI